MVPFCTSAVPPRTISYHRLPPPTISYHRLPPRGFSTTRGPRSYHLLTPCTTSCHSLYRHMFVYFICSSYGFVMFSRRLSHLALWKFKRGGTSSSPPQSMRYAPVDCFPPRPTGGVCCFSHASFFKNNASLFSNSRNNYMSITIVFFF